MRRATDVLRNGRYAPEAIRDTLILDYEARNRRRTVLCAESKEQLLLDLTDVPRLRDKDALVLDDGSLVVVRARPEPLLEITADNENLMRIGWHLGNRHIPVQFAGRALRIRDDHVIADMVRRLGGDLIRVDASFDPEGGAYELEAADHHFGSIFDVAQDFP
jgi:urease accessory protein